MIAVLFVYAGLIIALVGLAALVHPLKFIGIKSRLRGVAVFLIGLVLIGVGWSLPAPEKRVSVRRTRLDELMPVYQFNEFHSVRVSAPPDVVYRAIKAVRADEIRLFRTLTWIRRFGASGPESILNAPETLPILEVATRTSFLVLAEVPNQELVVGTIVAAPDGWNAPSRTPDAFNALSGPGFAKATMNFRIEPDSLGGSRVTTETRVFATDAPTRRRFARYWRVIFPGSALIRRGWLGAIKRRAESATRSNH